jgi:hypothetical protein
MFIRMSRNIVLVFLVLQITSANYSAGPFAKWTVQNAWKHPECATEIQKVLSPDLEEEVIFIIFTGYIKKPEFGRFFHDF